MLLYDKNGKAYDVPHAVDVNEWLATKKYSKKKPNSKKVEPALEARIYVSDGEKYKDFITKLDTLLADDVRFVAGRLGIVYVTKDEAVSAIKVKIGIA